MLLCKQQTKSLLIMPTYLTHDNYDRPFKVVITKKASNFEVKLFQSSFDEERGEFDFAKSRCFLNVVSPKVFVAREHNTPPKVRMRKHFWHEDGHVVVVEVNPHEYVYVGASVYKFTTIAKLVRLESFIGNNDVPHPCVIDQDHNVYLLTEHKVIKHLTRKAFGNSDDVYDFYYKHKNKIPKDNLADMQTKIIRKRS